MCICNLVDTSGFLVVLLLGAQLHWLHLKLIFSVVVTLPLLQ